MSNHTSDYGELVSSNKGKVSDEGIMSEDKGYVSDSAPDDSVDSVSKAGDAAPKAKPLPQTKAGMLKAAYDKMSKMKKDDLKKNLESWVMEAKEEDEEEEEDEDDTDSDFMKEKKAKKEQAKKKDSMKEDLQALVDSEATLSEGFKEKAEVIFEAAVSSKVADHVARLEEAYTQELEEEKKAVYNEMVDMIDGYLTFTVEGWVEENKIAIENGLRTEIAESFMSSLKDLFTEHYVEIPDSKVDLVDELAEKNEKLEEQLSASINRAMKLSEQVKDLNRKQIVTEASDDLSVTQAEKLIALTEDLDFEDPEKFSKKVKTIKESYFRDTSDADSSESSVSNFFTEEAETPEELEPTGRMAEYLKVLSQSSTTNK